MTPIKTDLGAAQAKVQDELIQATADHDARMSALRAKKAEIDEAVLVQTRESAIAAKGAHGERQIKLIHAMCADEEIRLAAIERLEGHLRAAVADINEAFAAAERVRAAAKDLAFGANARTTMLHFSQTDFVNRTGGRIAGLMCSIKGYPYRLGPVVWEGGSLHPATQTGWRDQEERAFAPSILAVTETVREQA